MTPFAHLKHAALSDVGKKRKNNEDAFGTFPEAGIFCVADGMGGGDDGEIASAAVVRAVEELAVQVKPDESGGVCSDDVRSGLAAALSSVSAWICNRAHERKLNGCGSTFVGVVFDPTNPAQAVAVHAGDSRLYLLHGHSIRQITRDHSVAELMGEKDESKVNPMFRSMVVNGIGIRDKADPEFTPFKVVPGDRVLLCSDGLSRMVPDKRIASIARAEESPDKAVAALIAAALDAGGVDNVTAVLVQVGELPPPMTPRKLAPVPKPPEEEETEDGDGATSSRDTGKTDEARTCATQLPGIAEEEAFGSETPKPADEFPAAKSSRPRLPRWVVWLGLSVLIAAIVGGIVLICCQRRSDSRPSDVKEVPAHVEMTATNETTAPAEAPATAKPPAITTPPAPVVVPATSPAPALTAKSLEKPKVPVDAPAKPSASPKAPSVCAAEFIAACGDDSAQAFIRTLRRLLPQEDRTPDFSEESDRFLKSARKLALTRSGREAETAAVDLRVLLLNAEAARSAPVLRKADAAAKSVLSAWDDVLKGDPAAAATQTSCARLMGALKDLHE
jgi:protein phosphatase